MVCSAAHGAYSVKECDLLGTCIQSISLPWFRAYAPLVKPYDKLIIDYYGLSVSGLVFLYKRVTFNFRFELNVNIIFEDRK
jgi:hypothetical protein